MVLASCPDSGGGIKYDYDFRPAMYWSSDAVTVNIAGQWAISSV